MTTIEYVAEVAIPGAYRLLPESMRSANATAMLMAIAGQESNLSHRMQIGGPARGFFQFEAGGGVAGVMTHPATKAHAARLLSALCYADATITEVHVAITHNDVLAAAFARLLLWTDREPLPPPEDPSAGWRIYLRTWRPGKPHPDTWVRHFAAAWALVGG